MKYGKAKKVAEEAGFKLLFEEAMETFEEEEERTGYFLSSAGILRIIEDLRGETVKFTFYNEIRL